MKKGITLVALVVTIVILLILATVTIGLILGDNSMFNRANEGKDKTEFTQLGERLQSAGASVIVDSQTNPTFGRNEVETVRLALVSYLNEEDALKITEPSFTKDATQNIYTFTRTEGKFQLQYTLDLTNNESSYKINDV